MGVRVLAAAGGAVVAFVGWRALWRWLDRRGTVADLEDVLRGYLTGAR